jgi:hypothetical protein
MGKGGQFSRTLHISVATYFFLRNGMNTFCVFQRINPLKQLTNRQM